MLEVTINSTLSQDIILDEMEHTISAIIYERYIEQYIEQYIDLGLMQQKIDC